MCIIRRTAIAVGGEGIASTTWFTVASPSAKTASMICRSRRLSSDDSGMVDGSRPEFGAPPAFVKILTLGRADGKNYFVNFLTRRRTGLLLLARSMPGG